MQGNVESDGLLRQASKHGVVFGLCSFNVTQGQAKRKQRRTEWLRRTWILMRTSGEPRRSARKPPSLLPVLASCTAGVCTSNTLAQQVLAHANTCTRQPEAVLSFACQNICFKQVEFIKISVLSKWKSLKYLL